MSKFKTSKKSLKRNFEHLISVPNSALQYILWAYTPTAYVRGRWGWDADIYKVSPNTCIVTGIKSFGNRHPSEELCKKFNDKGKELFEEYHRSNDNDKYGVLQEVYKLLNGFCIETIYKERK